MATARDSVDAGVELPGMPPPWELHLDTVGQNAVVSYGARPLVCHETGDRGMRHLAIVSLTRAGFSCNEVGRVFGRSLGILSGWPSRRQLGQQRTGQNGHRGRARAYPRLHDNLPITSRRSPAVESRTNNLQNRAIR